MKASAYSEEALVFRAADDMMVGILSRPTLTAASLTGVLIVVGGPQYRAGSHRQFVLWSRAMAAAGVPVMRFDVRGMGDASGAQRHFTAQGEDIRSAIDALCRAQPDLQRVVLCGLCDGASAALLYLESQPDPRVAGLMLLNPWVRSEQTLSRTIVKHYYLQRLTDWGFWAKLLRGGVALAAVRELMTHIRSMQRKAPASAAEAGSSYQERMLAALTARQGPVLLALSGNDYTAKEFMEYAQHQGGWAEALGQPGLTRLDLEGADHTVSDASHRQQLEAASVAWLSAQGFLTC